MRPRLGISISVGTLDLTECGPAAEEGQSPHDHIPLYFIAAPSTAARRPSAERFLKREAEHDGTAHVNGMQATSRPCRTLDTRSQARLSVSILRNFREADLDRDGQDPCLCDRLGEKFGAALEISSNKAWSS
jgi:hypothetical protein